MLADPIFWLALSLFCVAVSFTTVLLVAVPALRELSRMARSADRLLDTLDRELPSTLDTLRRTGGEVADLTDELQQGVQSASRIVGQVDQSLSSTRQQVQTLNHGSRSLWAGVKAAWQVWAKPTQRRPKPKKLGHRRSTLAEPRPVSPSPPRGDHRTGSTPSEASRHDPRPDAPQDRETGLKK